MPITLTFAEQATGIVTRQSGERALGEVPSLTFRPMHEALGAAENYLRDHPDHEAWIATGETRQRITLPSDGSFAGWIESYRRDGSQGLIHPGISLGQVVSLLGFPSQCSLKSSGAPLAVILRYPGDIDFHFDKCGNL